MDTRIRSLELRHIAVPLKSEIRHASHSRSTSDSLVVKVCLRSGEVGFGEGVPRSYVTGETIDSTFEALSHFDIARAIDRPADSSEVIARVGAVVLPESESDPRQMAGNAARCALELGVLDAYGRRFGQPVGMMLRLAEIPGVGWSRAPARVRYSGAITAADPYRE